MNRTANDLRMSMNDLCDEIFNRRYGDGYYTTCRPPEPPLVCRECDAPLDDGERSLCDDCEDE